MILFKFQKNILVFFYKILPHFTIKLQRRFTDMITNTPEIITKVKHFQTKVSEYLSGTLENLKPYSSIMGIYKEGSKNSYMIRPRFPGGIATLEQLQAIANIANKYSLRLRFTTRQDLQLHAVPLEKVNIILDNLLQVGLITTGAGGDGIRNITCSPLSGIARDEIFDVTPYMLAITNFMLRTTENLQLPRKYKVSFSNTADDTANASISDLGFIAKKENNKLGFCVYAAGGLGSNSQLAIKLSDFILAEDALFYVEAMKNIFAREGDRTNRNKARLRFVRQRLGDEVFLTYFQQELHQLKLTNPELKLTLNPTTVATEDNSFFPWDKEYQNIIFPQKQSGLYAIYIHPSKGEILPTQILTLTEFLKAVTPKVELRLTSSQGFFVRNLSVKAVDQLLLLTDSLISPFSIDNTVSCAGPQFCNFGINDSQSLLTSILEFFKNQPLAIKSALPTPLISGCPNSCAQHQKGLIGFTGRKKRLDGKIVDTYLLSLGGRVGYQAKFGENIGEILATRIPAFLLELAILKAQYPSISFSEFLEQQHLQILNLTKAYLL